MTIRKSIRLERTPEVSFKVFCEEIAQWWPGGFGGKDAKIFIENHKGGRFYERRADGSEYEIGRVTAYQPPAIVAFTWRAPSWETATLVQVRFTAEDTGTRVELEHSGWEENAKAGETRGSYNSGWEFVLGHYQRHLAAATSQPAANS
ncbi:MAG TPA: SRPBCC domain-containing protein [Candidatus Binataceae bacterium]|nr:SRPBCC domain-containing protein [Candidatus Binataceae bacterium]